MNEMPSEYYNLQVKKWRALTYDFDTLSLYGQDSKLYCLTDFQAAWLLSNAPLMAWKSRWQDCPCTEQELQTMAAELEYNLMNCFDTRWMGQLQYVYDRIGDEQLEQFQIEYDTDGIEGINADTPTDFYNGDDSTDRQLALCMACDTYVRSYLNNWLSQAALLVGLVSILGIVVSSTPFIGLIVGVIVGGFVFMTQTAVDAVNDAEAVNDVICCMFNGLYDVAVNEANFQTCMDACGFDGGTNQAIIRDIVASDLNQSKNWFSFLNALGNSWILLQAGADYECDCVPEPQTWHYDVDFTNLPAEIVIASGTLSGADVLGVNVGAKYDVTINVLLPADTTLTRVRAQATVTSSPDNGIYSRDTAGGGAFLLFASIGTGTRTGNWTGNRESDSWFVRCNGGSAAGCKMLGGQMFFEGKGLNPFV